MHMYTHTQLCTRIVVLHMMYLHSCTSGVPEANECCVLIERALFHLLAQGIQCNAISGARSVCVCTQCKLQYAPLHNLKYMISVVSIIQLIPGSFVGPGRRVLSIPFTVHAHVCMQHCSGTASCCVVFGVTSRMVSLWTPFDVEWLQHSFLCLSIWKLLYIRTYSFKFKFLWRIVLQTYYL